MTYIPGLKITYDEDEMKPAGKKCIKYDEFRADWTRFCLFPFFSLLS
jgi:hypothetical protein